MDDAKTNYQRWIEGPLGKLQDDSDAGFAILMIVIPVLERYLREKSGCYEVPRVKGSSFYQEFVKIFPLLNETQAEQFWKCFRHGLMHQVAFNLKNVYAAGITIDTHTQPINHVSAEKRFLVNPQLFKERVLSIIADDFSTFEGAHSLHHPLPTISSYCDSDGRPTVISGACA